MENFDENFDDLYHETGYSNKGQSIEEMMLYNYGEMDPNLMEYAEKPAPNIKTFNLTKAQMDQIIRSITKSAAFMRTGQKSMMSPQSSTIVPIEIEDEDEVISPEADALIQTRQEHMEEVARIAKTIAGPLGLNINLAEASGISHDIGHSFNGHSGERMIEAVAMLHNCGHFVHSAMGAYVMEREKIVKLAFEELKQLFPKVDEQDAREFTRYVIDGVISHNGEGVVGTIIPKDKTAEKMQEELRRCFTEKGFDKKIIPATMEAGIIRFADIMAYMRSDILDGFRMKNENGEKILNGFDRDYLAIIGTCLARERISQNGDDKFAKKMLDFENKSLLEIYKLDAIINNLEQKENKTPDDEEEIIRRQIERRLLYKEYERFTNEIKIKYAEQYIYELESQDQSRVKERVTNKKQNVFIKDLVEESKGKDYLTLSPLIRKTFFALRDLNVRKIVPYTRREYEYKNMPMAVNQLVEQQAESLLKTGIVRKAYAEDSEYEMTAEQKNYVDEIEKGDSTEFERKIYHYIDKLTMTQLKELYNNTKAAIEDIANLDLGYALGEKEYSGDLDELYRSKIIGVKHFLTKKKYPLNKVLTKEQRESALKDLIQERMKKLDETFTYKLAAEYIAGMTDRSILQRLFEKGLMTNNDIKNGINRKEADNDIGLTSLQKVFSKNDGMIVPDGDNEIVL